MKKNMVLLVLSLSFFLNACSPQKPTEQIDKNIKISTIRQAYVYADNYAKRNLGDKYVLYRIEGKHDKDFNGEIKFIYTKRVKHSPDGYFVIVDTVNNEITYNYWPDARRLFGGNHDIQIESWDYNIEAALTAASDLGIGYDELRWFTVFFIKNGVKIDQLDFNTFTGERITDDQGYFPDFVLNQQ